MCYSISLVHYCCPPDRVLLLLHIFITPPHSCYVDLAFNCFCSQVYVCYDANTNTLQALALTTYGVYNYLQLRRLPGYAAPKHTPGATQDEEEEWKAAKELRVRIINLDGGVMLQDNLKQRYHEMKRVANDRQIFP